MDLKRSIIFVTASVTTTLNQTQESKYSAFTSSSKMSLHTLNAAFGCVNLFNPTHIQLATGGKGADMGAPVLKYVRIKGSNII